MEQAELSELLEKSRERAKEILDLKAGRGLMIFKDAEGNIDLVPFGGDVEMAIPPSEQNETIMDLILSLILTYLPGSSVEYINRHIELMTGLRAINTNVTSLFTFLKGAFPHVQVQGLKQDPPSGSGIILG